MKKIITLILLFVFTFSSGYATTSDSIELTQDDIIYANIFYINWEGYLKDNWKLKKVEWIKFYSIAWQRYIKKWDKVIKVKESKIYKINDINYVKIGWRIMTLDKYLALNPIKEVNDKTFTDIFQGNIKKPSKLNLISKKNIELIKQKTLNDVKTIIKERYSNMNEYTYKYIFNTKNHNSDNFKKLSKFYFDKWDKQLAKDFYILTNIAKIDIDKVNKAILAKQNDATISYVRKKDNNENKDNDDEYSFSDLMKDIWIDEIEEEDNESEDIKEKKVSWTDTRTVDNNTDVADNNSVDEEDEDDIEEDEVDSLLKDLFN